VWSTGATVEGRETRLTCESHESARGGRASGRVGAEETAPPGREKRKGASASGRGGSAPTGGTHLKERKRGRAGAG
jgi:hypothetical protein